MTDEITFDELLKKLDKLPDIERSINITLGKRDLDRKRSNVFGSGSFGGSGAR